MFRPTDEQKDWLRSSFDSYFRELQNPEDEVENVGNMEFSNTLMSIVSEWLEECRISEKD